MTEANKEQIAFMRDCLNGMNEGNYEILKKITLDTLDRMENQLLIHSVVKSFYCSSVKSGGDRCETQCLGCVGLQEKEDLEKLRAYLDAQTK